MADAAVYIYGGSPGTTDTLLYTSTSVITIVRGIHIFNITDTPATVSFGLNTGASIADGEYWLKGFTLAGRASYDWSGFAVISSGETIRGLQGTASATNWSISGITY